MENRQSKAGTVLISIHFQFQRLETENRVEFLELLRDS